MKLKQQSTYKLKQMLPASGHPVQAFGLSPKLIRPVAKGLLYTVSFKKKLRTK